MQCRSGCGACCIQPSINTTLPEMPDGKPAGVSCIHLDQEMKCLLFGSAARPKFCGEFLASEDICGNDREEALKILGELERATRTLDQKSSLVPKTDQASTGKST